MAACDISKFAVSKPEDWAAMARVAEQAERYEDMCAFMRQLVTQKTGGDLSVEERNLLSVAYKNVVGARRASWRTLNTDEYKDNEHIAVYKSQLEHELESTCLEVLKLLENVLIPATTPPNKAEDEPRVFYLKMTGDYYRYLAEFIEGKGYDQKANEYYSQAMETAEAKLSATHPIRLGLALNYSVCHYEILKNQKAACDLAKKAFDEAISKLDQLDEASYKDSTLIMQLLRDNLTLWTSETDADDDAGDN